ncbi:hypothetical protein [Nocardia sp. SYP-A9097]|uniref:hypothetical protein n=1 Tax=Nocardia sp. SYP-A9097 TaxID=2663237 RepID=UPI001E2BB956|nr:hypothetical protein [Nocardia sp. SYP-A9097]
MDGITRALLERYLAALATDPRALHSRSRDIGSLSAFLDAIRRHEWGPSLPTTAAFYPDDFPKPDKRLPRGLAEQIMVQAEQPANLDRWNHPESRLVTLILMRCGSGTPARSDSTASSETATTHPTCTTPTGR